MGVKTRIVIIIVLMVAIYHQGSFAEDRCLELSNTKEECAKLWH